jgi:hypothetical protein
MTKTESNPFLENQARIMAAREQQQREAKTHENEPGRPTPKAQTPFDPSEPTTVHTYDSGMNLISTREIPNDRTLPVRPVKPELPALKALKLGLTNLGNAVDSAREQFAANNENLSDYYSTDEQQQLRSDIADLQAQLAEKTDRLNELVSKPSPKAVFYDAVKDAECGVVQLARALVERLSSDAALKVFGVDFQQLSAGSRKDVGLRFKSALSAWLDGGGSFTILTRNPQASVDQIDQRADKVLEAVNSILDLEFLAEN